MVSPDVWEDVITERTYGGEKLRDSRYFAQGDSVLGQVSFQTRISVLADAYALENFTAIRYVEWAGARWTVTSVSVERPRLILVLGEVYNGPGPDVPKPDPKQD